MEKADALAAIKALRDRLMNEADSGPDAEGWELDVAERLDRAGDLIEFPKLKKAKE